MGSETLANRVKRIVSGGAHALVSAIEDLAPEAVMEEAIRELDGVVDDVRSELGRTLAAKHLASQRLMQENRRYEELGDGIDVAMTEGRDDLAKVAIARQLDIEAQIPILESSISEALSKEKELEGYVAALLAKRREMADELSHYRTMRKNAQLEGATSAGDHGDSVATRADRAQNAFDRVMGRQTGLPAGRGIGSAKDAMQLQELETLTRDRRIEERLARLKAEQSSESK